MCNGYTILPEDLILKRRINELTFEHITNLISQL